MAEIAGTLITRQYKNLLGVDFSSDDAQMDLRRSPYAVNVYKDYKSALGQAVETRPGFRILKQFQGVTVGTYTYEARVIAEYSFSVDGREYFLAHVAEYDTTTTKYVGKLYQWTNYPWTPATFTALNLFTNRGVSLMDGETARPLTLSAERSEGFVFGEKFYIVDGANYVAIQEIGTTTNNVTSYALYPYVVKDYAFVPTTYTVTKAGISAAFQDYNTLTGKQKNQFEGKASTDLAYQLIPHFPGRALTIEDVSVNGETVSSSSYSVNDYDETNPFLLTFTTAPGEDSVIVVEFSQAINNSGSLAENLAPLCDKICVFDNRVFFANCAADRTKYLWSALNNAEYVPYFAFEYAGKDSVEVTSLILMSDSLALIKKNSGIYNIYGITTGDDLSAKTYANKVIAASIGGYGGGANFLNDIVFVSKEGLKAITQLDLHNERNISHRSKYVDGKLRNESGLQNAICAEFRGYLFILVNGRCYLADSRQKSSGEYEWYFWDNVGVYSDGIFSAAMSLYENDDKLYFGTGNGCLCVFNTDMTKGLDSGELESGAYADESLVNGVVTKIMIPSCWTTPMDEFNYRNRFKRCNKKGAMADLKSFAHSICKVGVKTNGVSYADLKRHNGGYFDFSDLDFEDFTFNTNDKNVFYFAAKDKKWERISLRFYSDEIYKPFGVFGATLEAYIMGYAKER